jgi:tetratricopeptide (TPR) repeat protein
VDIPKQSKLPKPSSHVQDEGITQGIEENDNGNYEGAIKCYKQVLEINPDNITAIYETAYTYANMGDLKKCLEYSLKGLEYESPYISEFYMMAGNSLDYMGETEESLRFYDEAIKNDPSNFIIYYNAALAQYRAEKYNEAESLFERAISLNTKHASSYLALADLNLKTSEEMRAYLLTLKFLMLEPNKQRSGQALQILNYIREISLTKTGENSYTIALSQLSDSGTYFSIEMIFKLAQASRVEERKKGTSEMEILQSEFELVLSAIEKGEKAEKQIDSYLFDYFQKLKESGNSEAFIYYTHQQSGLPGIKEWLEDNTTKVDSLLEWDKNYQYSFR